MADSPSIASSPAQPPIIPAFSMGGASRAGSRAGGGGVISRQAFLNTIRVIDTFAICLSAVVALGITFCRDPLAGPSLPVCMLMAVLLSVVVMRVLDSWELYALRNIMRGRHAVLVALAWCVSTAPMVAIALMFNPEGAYARGWLITWFVGGLVIVPSLRRLTAAAARSRWGELIGDRACVVGPAGAAAICVEQARRHASEVILLGYFDDGTEADASAPVSECPRLGAVDDAVAFARTHRVDAVILALPLEQQARISEIARRLRQLPLRVLLAPGLASNVDIRIKARAQEFEIGNVVLVPLAEPPLIGGRWLCKDLVDRAIALVAAFLLLPVFAVVSAAILLTDGRPVLFRQSREGYGGSEFEIFKFRTMRHVAAAPAPDARLILATKGDARVFPFGRFLRRTSLDELPQLLNVILGDMWVVGPRPHSPLAHVAGSLYAEAVEEYASRYRIKPGMTGWAQVNGWRGPTETLEQIAKRVEFDLFYIENWSFLFDLRILFRTVTSVLRHHNAF